MRAREPELDGPRRVTERENLLSAVESLRDVLETHAAQAESDRTLPRPVVDAMLNEGLLQFLSPREVGGGEADPLTHLEVMEAVARIDTSAAWSLMIGAATTTLLGAYLPDSVVGDVFGAGQWPISAGQLAPLGHAERVEGGYNVTGRWAFGSGISHSTWVVGGAFVEEAGESMSGPDGAPIRVIVIAPKERWTVHDTWQAAGLKGSGSSHYSLDREFIANDFVIAYPTPEQHRGGAVYRETRTTIIPVGHTGFALGVARRVLDEITKLAHSKMRGYGPNRAGIAGRSVFQKELAEADTRVRAARLLAFDVFGRAWDAARAGDPGADERQAETQLAATYVTDVAAEVAGWAYRFGGGDALYESSPLQHYWRDINAATQHFFVADVNYERYGQIMLGMGPGAEGAAGR
ncbi:MAG: acyl-CoA dehydrogenase family protein [Chloroflexi bacterium]|nr:acyl-CoA dehydrogenase family protein [Chloroflexota bacterium]